MNRLLNPLWTRVLQPAKSFLFLYKKRHHHTVKRIRCLRENGFRELEVPKGSLHHASNSFIENSDSCEGWKCKRMDLNFHSPSSKSPLLIQPHTPAVYNNLGLDFQSFQWLFNFRATKCWTYKGNSWGTSKSTFFSTNKIHLPPCWKLWKRTWGHLFFSNLP